MTEMSSPRSKVVHWIIALACAGLFLGGLRLLPSLRNASNAQVALRLIIEICASLALLYLVNRFGAVSRESLGIRRFRVATVGWGVLCFLASAVLSAGTLFVFARFHIAQDKGLLTSLASRPIPIILLIAASAGIAEEIVFRSILISQFQAASGSAWVAGILSLVLFALAHVAGWGPWQIVFAAVPGAVLTLFFIWKRDLWICVIAHFLTDALGLLGAAAGMAQHHS
jgi:membrane protease YdiL (CAAX protease family)